MSLSYQEMLKVAKEKLPQTVVSKERFEVPSVKGHVEGNKTIIINFVQVVETLQRDPAHLVKFLQRELATPAVLDGPRLVLGRKLNSQVINQKVQVYANDFVICKECGKPDTKLLKEDRVLFLKCTACGAKEPIRAKL
ncbi:MAG TPA: translation initiation factor IF-2 subunit beta [Candidatus Nanoarchaeia archaeon]|nr:translation initiation factor IF-2 subunit beta [Candidatus Nanoarchaeia archaeon]